MKHLYKISMLFLVFSMLITSCETQQTLEITSPEPSFTLNTPGITNVFLNYSLPDNPAFTITWNDEVTGSSSYSIEMATEETFASPIMLGTSETNNFSMTVDEFNTVINNAGITNFTDVPVYLRVKAGENISNQILLLVTTYPVNPPVLTSPTNEDTFELMLANAANELTTVTWEDPILGTSMNITINYAVEVVLSGNDFSNALNLVSVNNSDNIVITHADLNNIALSAGIEAGMQGNLDLRLVATITNTNGDELVRISEVNTISVLTYDINFPYIYLVGDATTPGWDNNNNNTPLFRSQSTPNSYYITGYFNAGSFKLLENKGQWQPQWGTNDGSTLAVNDGSSSDPGTFNVASAGYYTYTFSSLTPDAGFTVTSYDASSAPTYSSIGLIGSATPLLWDAQTSLNQDPNNPHLWFINGITLTNGGEFLIRANDNWNDAIWRYTGSEELFGTGLLAGSGDNFPFNGETGSYDVWFNDLDGSYVIIPN